MLPNHPALRELLGAAYADRASPDQLTQLQRTAPDQIRTPGALGSNLLADALLQWGASHQKPGSSTTAGPTTTAPASGASYGFWPSLDARFPSYRLLAGQAPQPSAPPGGVGLQGGPLPGQYDLSWSNP